MASGPQLAHGALGKVTGIAAFCCLGSTVGTGKPVDLRSGAWMAESGPGRWCIFTCFVHRDNSWKLAFVVRTVPCNATYLPTTQETNVDRISESKQLNGKFVLLNTKRQGGRASMYEPQGNKLWITIEAQRNTLRTDGSVQGKALPTCQRRRSDTGYVSIRRRRVTTSWKADVLVKNIDLYQFRNTGRIAAEAALSVGGFADINFHALFSQPDAR
ncbi:hypothetical protein B0H10DRAFT_1971513 [Mycena sp. CBHHK59/15]|nr:hypothetical protein B0H10DRAFT_1971513 [Mycena sp. CBHHK59/15]